MMRRATIVGGVGLLFIVSVLFLSACGTAEAPTATPSPTPMDEGEENIPTPTPDNSFDAEAHFEGKTVRMIMSASGPGGGTDIAARLVAARWGEFIPGNPRIVTSIVPRIPGYHAAWDVKEDELKVSFGGTPQSIIDRQVFPESRYDVRQLRYLGALGESPSDLTIASNMGAGADLPYQSIEDAMGKSDPKLRMAGVVPGPIGVIRDLLYMPFVCDELELPCEFLNVADESSGTLLLMFERGEINTLQKGSFWTNGPTQRPGWWSEEKVTAFAVTSPDIDPAPNNETGAMPPPRLVEYLDEEASELYRTFYGIRDPGQHMWVGPAMPDEVMQVLRDSFEALANDPQFVEIFERTTGNRLADAFFTGAEMDAMMHPQTDRFLANLDRLEGFQQDIWDRWWAP